MEKASTIHAYRRCPDPSVEYAKNEVITSRYTSWNFIPKFLFEQFLRFANAYFLLVSVLQAIPPISITSGIPTGAVPLAFVLLFDALVTAREDYKRHRDDNAANNAKTLVLREGTFVEASWKDIKVGDIIKVFGGSSVPRGSELPADCVFLSAPQEAEATNKCYIQTAQLDGETNLKMRKAVPETATTFLSDECCAAFRGHIEAEPPRKEFGAFNGAIVLDWDGGRPPVVGSYEGADAQGPLKVQLTADQTLLRGCVLRNVKVVYAMVVYTGPDTKVRMGAGKAKQKKGSIEREINHFVLLLVGLLVVTCLVGSIWNTVWTEVNETSVNYLELEGGSFGSFIQKFFTFFLVNANMIPVSLYVTMKLTRQFQKFFMELDVKTAITNAAGDTTRLKVRSMDLNDELGQITHIFSDKTGTLTSNYMEFKKLIVNSVPYGLGITEIGIARRERLYKSNALSEAEWKRFQQIQLLMKEQERKEEAGEGHSVPHVFWIDGSEADPNRTLAADMKQFDDQAEFIHQMMLNLVLDHTVEYESAVDENGNPVGQPRLSASSPEEEAFVYAARLFGYNFVDRRLADVIIDRTMPDGDVKRVPYRIVETLAYTSQRKMMSVLVRDPEGKYFLYAKGAGSKIYSRLASSVPQDVKDKTEQCIEDWSTDAFRCLAFAYREVPKEEAEAWLDKLGEARSDPAAAKAYEDGNEDSLIFRLMEDMESNLLLQGATALEDRLQEHVPRTIETLGRAGVKVCMLTGDKQQTAEEIGYATKMLTEVPTGNIYRITSDEFRNSKEAMSVEALIQRRFIEASRTLTRAKQADPDSIHALVIDETALDVALPHPKGIRPMKTSCLKKARHPAASNPITDLSTTTPTVSSWGDHEFPSVEKLEEALLTLIEGCRAVICCRFRPDQKAAVVSLVRSRVPKAKTLAIGDGANDVPMICAAHVGVGISGAEGVQAANASDFAIARFHFLQRLLLVHGRWNYNRMAMVVLYMFYKNVVFSLAQYWYSTVNGWSGQKMFQEVSVALFNLSFTGLPILVVGIFDQDIKDTMALKFPYVYREGQTKSRLNMKLFILWCLSGIIDSLIIFGAASWGIEEPAPDFSTPYIFQFGVVVFAAVICVVSVRVAIETNLHDWRYQVFIAISVLCYIPLAFILDALNAEGMRDGADGVFTAPLFYLMIALVMLLCSGYILAIKAYNRFYRPTYAEKVQEFQLLFPDKLGHVACGHRVPQLSGRDVGDSARHTVAKRLQHFARTGEHLSLMAPTKEVEEEKKVLVGAEPEVKSPEGEERKVGEVEIHVEPHREGGLGMESGLSVDERGSRWQEQYQTELGLALGAEKSLTRFARERLTRSHSVIGPRRLPHWGAAATSQAKPTSHEA